MERILAVEDQQSLISGNPGKESNAMINYCIFPTVLILDCQGPSYFSTICGHFLAATCDFITQAFNGFTIFYSLAWITLI